jgi:hypothetical protein
MQKLRRTRFNSSMQVGACRSRKLSKRDDALHKEQEHSCSGLRFEIPQCSCKEIVMSIYRPRMRYDSSGKATTPRKIGSIVVLLGVVGFIVFLAWGTGPNGTRNVAHTPVTLAETNGMGGSYDLP